LAIKKLLELMSDINIAEMILDQEGGEHELGVIGREAQEGFQADWKSMAEWRADNEKGIDLITPATKSRSTPWENASNFKSPILMEARLKFGDRASQELLRGDDLVKAKPVGNDPTGEKADRIERVEATMDYQLTTESDTWVKEQDKLLYDVSCQGSMFKKTFYNSNLGHNESEVIKFPNFAISQEARTLETAPRFTHRIYKSPREVQELILSGAWLDRKIELGAKTGEREENEATQDKITEFYEQETWLDLDGDDYSEPYIVTLHAASGSVVRIVAQYNLDDIIVMDEIGRASSVDRLILRDNSNEPIFIDDELQFEGDIEERTVVKITRDEAITEYPFISDPKGNFLSVGYFHVLGAYCQGINTTTNQLIDAGTMANLQGGWLARGFRKKLGNLKIKPGTFHSTDISAQDLATGIRLYDFKEPSPTLFQLNQSMQAEAQRLSSTTDLSAALGQNTPATTALSIVQEQQEANGALILRIYRAMAKEFRIWFKLNAKFMDPAFYSELVDNKDADPIKDFSMSDMDIIPAMNPQSSSTIQRLQKANAQLSILGQIEQSGGDVQAVIKGYLEAIGTDNIEAIYPELTEEQQAAQQAEQERIKQLNEELRFLPIKAQADIGEAERLKAEVKLGELQIKMRDSEGNERKVFAETQLTQAKIGNTEADTYLKAEQAETESTKNATNIVHAELKIKEFERMNEEDIRKNVVNMETNELIGLLSQ